MPENNSLVRHPYSKHLKNNVYKSLNLFAGEFGSKPYDSTNSFTKTHLISKILDEYLLTSNYKPLTNINSQFLSSSNNLNNKNKDNNKDNKDKDKLNKKKSILSNIIDELNLKLLSKFNNNLNNKDNNNNNNKDKNKNELILYKDENNEQQENKKVEEKNEILKIYEKNNEIENIELNKNKIKKEIEKKQFKEGAIISREKRRKLEEEFEKWKLFRVVTGHQGWIHALEVDENNEFFCTAGADRLIKIWDLASCELKLSLTGHSSTIRAINNVPGRPYLVSSSDDAQIKLWDLEKNTSFRNFHGHLSSVRCLSVNSELNLIFSGSRDATVRVWDLRSSKAVHVLTGHSSTVHSIISQNSHPQLLSSSQDSTIRSWDLISGKSNFILTHHKKGIRSLLFHPVEYSFCSCSSDNIKIWSCPNGTFLRNISNNNSIINTCDIKVQDNDVSILVCGTDDGFLHFFNYHNGFKYQSIESILHYGSLLSDHSIFNLKFDQSKSRLITVNCDKTIKIYNNNN